METQDFVAIDFETMTPELTSACAITRKLTNTEIKAIKDVLLAYDVLEAEMRKEAKDELVKSLKGE